MPADIERKDIKIVHISRNPKDVVVSYFHFSKMNTFFNYQGSWEAFLRAFMEGEVAGGLWFDYQKDWMQYRNNPNILFIEYEQFLADTPETIRKIARFLEKPLTESQVDQIAEIVSFKSMKNNPNLNRMKNAFHDKSKGQFLRSGKAGNWKSQFTAEQEEAFDTLCQKYSI